MKSMNRARSALGAAAMALGCFGLLAFVFFSVLSVTGAHFWTGFTPDGPSMDPVQREQAISERLHSDIIHRLIPLLVGSITLLVCGFIAIRREQRRNDEG
jgi:hypothetical protein